MRDTFAIILAAGNGVRVGGKLKQFFTVDGRPLLHYSIETLKRCPSIAEIIAVVPKKKIAFAERLVATYKSAPYVRVIAGGPTRRASCFAALRDIDARAQQPAVVVIHDAVRPLFTKSDVDRLIQAARKDKAAMLGIRAIDTVAEVKKGFIATIPDRNKLYSTFTPHAYSFSLLFRAHTDPRNRADRISYDENSVLVNRIGVRIKLVEGSYPNLKLTYMQDLTGVEAYLKLRNRR